MFRRGTGDQTNFLSLVTTPFTSSISNQFVGLGFLQRNSRQADRQDTTFTVFAFGLDTPATAVPRLGSGRFAVDVFGFETFPGAEPNAFQGRGRFDVDFVSGLFSTNTNFTVRGLVTGTEIFGGGLDLIGGGRLSSSDGRFSGDVVYRNRLGGALSGRFFGANANEIGASFAGSSPDGSAFSGAFTGQRDASLNPANVSFSSLVTPQVFFADAATLNVSIPISGEPPRIFSQGGDLGVNRSQLNDQTSGNLLYSPPSSGLPGGQYTVTSIVPGDTNFTTYQASFGGQPTRLELYKTGSANRELALTYASFGRYSTSNMTNPFFNVSDRVAFVYGFRTPGGLFNNRTGNASYAGVAYGSAANPQGAIFDVTGTTQVAVDFSAMRLSGSLALRTFGLATPINYGNFNFSGQILGFQSQGLAEIAGTGGFGTVLLNFFGPSADEVAGPFRLRVPDGANVGTIITGVVAAKRQ